MNDTTTEKYIIDAKGKRLGRIATEAASVLMGKHTPEFVKNRVIAPIVSIENIQGMALSEKKLKTKEYVHYTGYPGGLRKEKMESLMERKGKSELLRKAIEGMIPRNRLRKERMKRLEISE